jgi:hypothetical protein
VRGTGSITRLREKGWMERKDGKRVWRGELWRGLVSLDGKRRAVYGPKQEDVVRKLDELRTAGDKGLSVAPTGAPWSSSSTSTCATARRAG